VSGHRPSFRPCSCECNADLPGECGDCGHGGCGLRRSKRLLSDDPLYCDACGNLMTREDLRDSKCPTLCVDCCNTIDYVTELLLEREHFDWFE
jgi:hypothetical protein